MRPPTRGEVTSQMLHELGELRTFDRLARGKAV